MNPITLAQASKLTSPNPVVLVCTERPDGGTNLVTVSWWSYVSFKPGMVVYAMSKKSYSGELIRDTKNVILATPGAAIASEVMACGSSSGRSTDKVKEFGIEMQAVADSRIRIPVHTRVAIRCTMKEFVEVGDHYLYICEVQNVYANEEEEAVFAWDGYSAIRPAK